MATTKRDYYEVLNVPRGATAEDIRKAYRRLAFQHHPDRNQDDDAAERFREVKEAYEILSDNEKRAMYDRFGHAATAQGAGNYGAGFSGFGIEDIFETFFGSSGAGRQRRRARPGDDLRVDMQISFEEAVFGTAKEVVIQKRDLCTTCTGSGLEPGSKPEQCPKCNGSGEIRRVHQSIFGQMVNVSVCDRCNGEGSYIAHPCHTCQGRRMIKTTKTLEIKVPAGVDEGAQLRLSGEGEPGEPGAPNGNLYVVLHVLAHRHFRRQGTEILLDVNINMAQAVLGDEVEVPTLEEPVSIKIQPGTQFGETIRLRGKGVPILQQAGRGDMMVRLKIETPTKLNDEQKKLFKQLANTFEGGVAPEENKGFFDKVKDAFGV
ncbi:MAG: molecular chaperone DnaJ [Chloroflexota bacterium]